MLQNVLVTLTRLLKFEYACFNFGKTYHDFLLLLIKNKTKLCHVHALANHRHLLFLVFDCWTCWWCICVVIGYIYVNVLPLKPSWQQQPLFFKKTRSLKMYFCLPWLVSIRIKPERICWKEPFFIWKCYDKRIIVKIYAFKQLFLYHP